MNKGKCQLIRSMAAQLPPMKDGNGVVVNHYRRMKRAFKSGGVNAILYYANKAANAFAVQLNNELLTDMAKPLAQRN